MTVKEYAKLKGWSTTYARKVLTDMVADGRATVRSIKLDAPPASPSPWQRPRRCNDYTFI